MVVSFLHCIKFLQILKQQYTGYWINSNEIAKCPIAALLHQKSMKHWQHKNLKGQWASSHIPDLEWFWNQPIPHRKFPQCDLTITRTNCSNDKISQQMNKYALTYLIRTYVQKQTKWFIWKDELSYQEAMFDGKDENPCLWLLILDAMTQPLSLAGHPVTKFDVEMMSR